MVGGRLFWVVPVGLLVGWELAYQNRVVVVKEIKTVERQSVKVEVAVVQNSDGTIEEVDILREDSDENGKDLEGSVLPAGDKSTPAVEVEVEVEEDEK